MKFATGKGSFLAIVAIVLAVFNAVAFVIPFSMGGAFWTGYGFAMLAILLTAGVGLYAFGKPGMKSKFYGIPLAMIAWPYLIAQLLVSLVEMAIPLVPFRYEILLNAILLAVVLVGLVGANAGREEVERVDAKVKGKVFYIKSLQGDVEAMIPRVADAALQKSLKALAEAIRYSDPMSGPQLAEIEARIGAMVAALGESLGLGNGAAEKLCAELQQTLSERNRKCKLLK